jgi:hypothetical protein
MNNKQLTGSSLIASKTLEYVNGVIERHQSGKTARPTQISRKPSSRRKLVIRVRRKPHKPKRAHDFAKAPPTWSNL